MNPWNLLWIVPLSASIGFLFAALMGVAKDDTVHCKDCVWYKPTGENPVGGEYGVCRKTTFNKDRPVPTNSKGYCHKAERKSEGSV